MTPLISRLSACVDAEGGDFEHHLGGDYKLLMRILYRYFNVMRKISAIARKSVHNCLILRCILLTYAR